MNATVQAYLRAFCDWNQSNWKGNLGIAKIAITAREARSTRMSPFFMQHRYEVDPIQIATKEAKTKHSASSSYYRRSPARAGDTG
ncbi:hypothetical protein PTT_18216 [Pyrenophora teres f. teres 0-1]|uniref:Uncharacterized protein n=1 Tax=Pyrenophora teres f. teres (strain 0-1) TaxID=861557 RepID=E3S687_PYRTT|nr:hypothetical protein PTT_18216 [Pyrenophora teres f. teres 0-1]